MCDQGRKFNVVATARVSPMVLVEDTELRLGVKTVANNGDTSPGWLEDIPLPRVLAEMAFDGQVDPRVWKDIARQTYASRGGFMKGWSRSSNCNLNGKGLFRWDVKLSRCMPRSDVVNGQRVSGDHQVRWTQLKKQGDDVDVDDLGGDGDDDDDDDGDDGVVGVDVSGPSVWNSLKDTDKKWSMEEVLGLESEVTPEFTSQDVIMYLQTKLKGQMASPTSQTDDLLKALREALGQASVPAAPPTAVPVPSLDNHFAVENASLRAENTGLREAKSALSTELSMLKVSHAVATARLDSTPHAVPVAPYVPSSPSGDVELSSLRAENSRLNDRLLAVGSGDESVRRQLSDETERLRDCKRKFEDLSDTNRRLTSEILTLETSRKKASEELSDTLVARKKAVEELSEALETSRKKELRDSSEPHKASEQDVESIRKLTAANAALSLEKDRSQESLSMMDERLKQAVRDKEALSKTVGELRESNREMFVNEARLRGNQIGGDTNMVTLLRDLGVVKSENVRLQAELTAAKESRPEVVRLQDELGARSRTEIAELREKLSSKTSEVERVQTQLSSKTSEVERVQTQLSSKTSEVERVQTQLSSKTSEVERVQTQLSSKTSEVERMQTQLISKTSEAERVQTELSSKTSKNVELQAQLSSMTSQIQQTAGLQGLIQGLYSKVDNMSDLGSVPRAEMTSELAECKKSLENRMVLLGDLEELKSSNNENAKQLALEKEKTLSLNEKMETVKRVFGVDEVTETTLRVWKSNLEKAEDELKTETKLRYDVEQELGRVRLEAEQRRKLHDETIKRIGEEKGEDVTNLNTQLTTKEATVAALLQQLSESYDSLELVKEKFGVTDVTEDTLSAWKSNLEEAEKKLKTQTELANTAEKELEKIKAESEAQRNTLAEKQLEITSNEEQIQKEKKGREAIEAEKQKMEARLTVLKQEHEQKEKDMVITMKDQVAQNEANQEQLTGQFQTQLTTERGTLTDQFQEQLATEREQNEANQKQLTDQFQTRLATEREQNDEYKDVVKAEKQVLINEVQGQRSELQHLTQTLSSELQESETLSNLLGNEIKEQKEEVAAVQEMEQEGEFGDDGEGEEMKVQDVEMNEKYNVCTGVRETLIEACSATIRRLPGMFQSKEAKHFEMQRELKDGLLKVKSLFSSIDCTKSRDDNRGLIIKAEKEVDKFNDKYVRELQQVIRSQLAVFTEREDFYKKCLELRQYLIFVLKNVTTQLNEQHRLQSVDTEEDVSVRTAVAEARKIVTKISCTNSNSELQAELVKAGGYLQQVLQLKPQTQEVIDLVKYMKVQHDSLTGIQGGGVEEVIINEGDVGLFLRPLVRGTYSFKRKFVGDVYELVWATSKRSMQYLKKHMGEMGVVHVVYIPHSASSEYITKSMRPLQARKKVDGRGVPVDMFFMDV